MGERGERWFAFSVLGVSRGEPCKVSIHVNSVSTVFRVVEKAKADGISRFLVESALLAFGNVSYEVTESEEPLSVATDVYRQYPQKFNKLALEIDYNENTIVVVVVTDDFRSLPVSLFYFKTFCLLSSRIEQELEHRLEDIVLGGAGENMSSADKDIVSALLRGESVRHRPDLVNRVRRAMITCDVYDRMHMVDDVVTLVRKPIDRITSF